ncbi:MAG: hypothetical protein ACK550_18035, partial [Synechococcaceae cyanobacterium]
IARLSVEPAIRAANFVPGGYSRGSHAKKVIERKLLTQIPSRLNPQTWPNSSQRGSHSFRSLHQAATIMFRKNLRHKNEIWCQYAFWCEQGTNRSRHHFHRL